MEIIAFNFITPLAYKNHTQYQIKKMITTSMLKRQAWMADNDKLDHILENSQRVLGLSVQYENH